LRHNFNIEINGFVFLRTVEDGNYRQLASYVLGLKDRQASSISSEVALRGIVEGDSDG
jgi:hypothetical protein